MVEIVGFVVGMFVLVGVFNDCLEMMFNIFVFCFMKNDGKFFNIKFDFEKILLL